MKRYVRSLLVFTLAGTAFADVKTLPVHPTGTTYSVTLTAAPANQAPFAAAVTLTAKVMQLPPYTMAQGGATPLVDSRLRYTFKAQRSSPSADPEITIAAGSSQASVSWIAQNAGDYTVTVRVTSLQILLTTPAKLPEVIGNATLNYRILAAPVGPDLVVDEDGYVGTCNQQDCTQCPYSTRAIYVKNAGNAPVSNPVTVTVKYHGQILQTWTANGPAAGQRVKVGTITDWTWNCPVITWICNPSPNDYVITVDATNAVVETNEQNNTKTWCERFPEKTSFHAAQ